MATVRDLVKGSLRLLGATAQGESPSAEEMADAISALGDMLDAWSAQKLMIYTKVREEFSLTSGQQSRTMGSGANFSTTKPAFIEEAKIEDQSSTDYPEYKLDIISVQEWAALSPKSLTADIPRKLYIEDTHPTLTLYFWPTPSATNKVVLYSLKPLSALDEAADAISLPPGYSEAIKYNLAVRLAPEYGKALSQEIIAIATDGFENIKRNNLQPQLMSFDPALVGPGDFNILTGE